MIDPAIVRARFVELYGREPRLFAAPGRVNLIGEHTDYNDGFVLPMAIDRGTVVAVAPRDDRKLRVRSLTLGTSAEIDLDATPRRRRRDWLDYVEGVARTVEARLAGTGRGRLRGADVALDSDVPAGAGLSSSAALEVSLALALLGASNASLGPEEVARAGQAAEHEYVGTQCGIMDQMIAALGKRDHALLIDCRSLAATLVSVDFSDAAIVIADTKVKHSLSSSAYNERRAECERAVALLQRAYPEVRALRDVTPEQLAREEERLPEPVRRRARHVVTENARTVAAAEALRRGALEEAGKLMYASHRSLRDDYEVSCEELDRLVAVAEELDGVLGARMTGGGFGGCTVTLVRKDAVARVTTSLEEAFRASFGRAPELFVTGACDGGREVST